MPLHPLLHQRSIFELDIKVRGKATALIPSSVTGSVNCASIIVVCIVYYYGIIYYYNIKA